MKKWNILLLALIASSASGVDLDTLGYTVVSTEIEGSRTVYEAEDSAGNSFTLSAAGDISSAQGAMIETILEEFTNWESLDVSYLRITLDSAGATVVVIPALLEHAEQDLTRFLPSGMQFYVTRAIEYDFRIRSQNIFVRLRGQLNEEARFIDRLAEAIADPAGFIERNDPEYVLRELRDIDVAITALGFADEDLGAELGAHVADSIESIKMIDASIDGVKETIADLAASTRNVDDAIRADFAETVSALRRLETRVHEIYDEVLSAFEAFQDEYFDTKARGIAVAVDYYETKESYLLLEERFQALTDDYEAVKSANAELFENQDAADTALQVQITDLRYALVAFANRTLFGRLRPVDPESAARALTLYDEDSTRTSSDIAELLTAEGIEINTRSVEWVLLVYRGIIEE